MGSEKDSKTVEAGWLHGEYPSSPVLFAACDSRYFIEHAPSFVSSANESGMDVHLHVINPANEVHQLFEYLKQKCSINVSMTWHSMSFEQFEESEERTYYACLRFLLAPYILMHAKKLLILDIDCMIMKPFEFPESLIAYFPREPLAGTVGWENEGTTVAAGAVYYAYEALEISTFVAKAIQELPLQWFVDQIALSRVFKQVEEVAADKVYHFDSEFMDWEFIEGTTIWTGKGPRKYDNPTYLAKKEEFKKCLV
jgi:hypothetical protein